MPVGGWVGGWWWCECGSRTHLAAGGPALAARRGLEVVVVVERWWRDGGPRLVMVGWWRRGCGVVAVPVPWRRGGGRGPHLAGGVRLPSSAGRQLDGPLGDAGCLWQGQAPGEGLGVEERALARQPQRGRHCVRAEAHPRRHAGPLRRPVRVLPAPREAIACQQLIRAVLRSAPSTSPPPHPRRA